MTATTELTIRSHHTLAPAEGPDGGRRNRCHSNSRAGKVGVAAPASGGVCVGLVLCRRRRLAQAVGLRVRLLEDVHHPAQGVGGGERQILAAQPVLQAHAAGRVKGALGELDHHQRPLQIGRAHV